MILVTGAKGQIGSDLVPALMGGYRGKKVIPTGIRKPTVVLPGFEKFQILDVTDMEAVREFFDRYPIRTVFHLAGLLSARGEEKPSTCWDTNINGLRNILDMARHKKCRVFWPSSIAVFGPQTPEWNTPQETVLDPTTMYGITKVSGEFLCRYYANHYAVDVRSLRFPGIIGYRTHPGGGTTDYAVEIFHEALKNGCYQCFVGPGTCLPMMYMQDATQAIIQLMDAPAKNIHVRTSYNITGISFRVEKLVEEIRLRIPSFRCSYKPDFRQKIADSWPSGIDDSQARKDWGWQHHFDLSAIVDVMLEKLREQTGSPQGSRL